MRQCQALKPLLCITAVVIIFSATGCNFPKDHLQTFNRFYESSDYTNCACFAQNKLKCRKTPAGEDLLWTVQLGSVERIRHDCNKSTEYFDKAEDMLKYFDEQSKIIDAIGSIAVNDNIVTYKGEEYDGVMINTYKALNFMHQGNFDLARVEFNRALDRQRRAKEKFSEEINKFKFDLEKRQKGNPNIKSSVENPKVQELLKTKYLGLYDFIAYPDFVNPFATYMAGIYFHIIGEYDKAADFFKESYGMVPDNLYIADDLAAAEMILDGNKKPESTVWVVFENGLGPIKDEFRLDLPLFVATNQVKYVGIALPKLRLRDAAYPFLTVAADGVNYDTVVIADMDRVVQTEFNKDFPTILTRAIISATVKAAAQYAMEQQQNGSITSTLMAIYSFATTAADVRIWTTLPKNFQVAKFKKPANGTIGINNLGTYSFSLNIPDCNNAIVYIRIPNRVAAPVYDVMTF